jgi:hypothetical protein
MLTPRRLQELACPAWCAWIVQHPVIWIVSHLLGMVESVDVSLVIPLRAQVQEDIRLGQEKEG